MPGKIQNVTDDREVKVLGFGFIHRENEFFYGLVMYAMDNRFEIDEYVNSVDYISDTYGTK